MSWGSGGLWPHVCPGGGGVWKKMWAPLRIISGTALSLRLPWAWLSTLDNKHLNFTCFNDTDICLVKNGEGYTVPCPRPGEPDGQDHGTSFMERSDDPRTWKVLGWSDRVSSGADPGFWKGGGSTMKDSEMSWRSQRGDAEGIAGRECERGLNPLSLGLWGSGGVPQKIFKILVLFPAI